MSRTTSDTGSGGGGGEVATTLHFADNGLYVPFSRVNPTAAYYDEKTYVVWQGTPNNLDPYIMAYNHATSKWSDMVKVGNNHLGDDDHGVPCIIRDNNEYLHVFYGAHNSHIQHTKSDAANDITAWTEQANIATAAAYPMVRTVGDNMYLFYRKTGTGRPLAYRKSIDNGSTFGGENLIIQFSGSDWIYVGGIDLESTTKIHIGWAYYNGSVRVNAYHAYLKLADNNMYSMGGTNLGTQIIKTEADTHCKVHDSTGTGVYNPLVRVDEDGVPYMTFYTAAAGCAQFTYWTGAAWSSPVGISAGLLNTAFRVVAPDRVELIGQELGYTGCSKWFWDGAAGATWKFADRIYTRSGDVAYTSTPKSVLNAVPHLQWLVAEEAADYTTPLKLYAYGIDGYVTRDVEE